MQTMETQATTRRDLETALIPPPPSNLAELSDADLEKVAGGTDVGILGLSILGIELVASAGASGAVATMHRGW